MKEIAPFEKILGAPLIMMKECGRIAILSLDRILYDVVFMSHPITERLRRIVLGDLMIKHLM